MSPLAIIILVVLIILLLGALPTWPHSRGFGWSPASLLGLALVVVLILLLTGAWHPAWAQDEAVATVVVEQPTVVDEIGDKLVEIAVLALTGIAAWIGVEVRKWVQSKLGERAANLVGGALERAVAAGVTSGRETVAAGVDYLKDQLPDSIRRLKLTDQQLHNLVKAEAAKPAVNPGRILQ